MHFGSEIFVNANMLSSDPRLPVLLQPSYNFGTSIKREIKNDEKYSTSFSSGLMTVLISSATLEILLYSQNVRTLFTI